MALPRSAAVPGRAAPARPYRSSGALALVLCLLGWSAAEAGPRLNLDVSADPHGLFATLNTAGRTDLSNPFFQSLGTNGRSCASCHDLDHALTITPAFARQRYTATRGRDPLFAGVDGANCPGVAADDAADHSLILNNGLIRIFLPLPAGAEFTLTVVHDPYGCALQTDPGTGRQVVSVYRRPLPATNLRFLSAVMFDARNTPAPLNDPVTFAANLRTDLRDQAIGATLAHSQATALPTEAQLAAIVDFELGLYSAQIMDRHAGPLTWRGGLGGPVNLSTQAYYPGINDSLGQNPTGDAFTPDAMALYGAWAGGGPARPWGYRAAQARADIAAGEQIFNSFPLTITAVRGLNDNDALGRPAAISGTCSTCHDAPNVADHSLPLPLDIGTSHSVLPGQEPDGDIAAALGQLSMPDLPVFLVSGCPDPFGGGAPASFYTSDPARALITGRCSDFNRGKGPILRGLAGRAPYFHNGAAADLRQVVEFYNLRFRMGLSARQKEQLTAFLNAL